MTIDNVFYYIVNNSESVTHRAYSTKLKEDGIKSGDFIVKFTEKNFPKFLPEALWRKLLILQMIFMTCAISNVEDKSQILNKLTQEIREYYIRFREKLKKQNDNFNTRPKFGNISIYLFKMRAKTCFFVYFPSIAVIYSKIRLKIRDLAGI